MEIKGLVSCIIPSYKRNDTLVRAIDSVLAQTYRHLEVLIVDDNIPGDDFSIKLSQLIMGYTDPRVRLITQTKHINGAEARNVGIRASKGVYIAFLDDDDEWLPTKIEKQVAVLNNNLDIHGVSCLYHEYKNGVVYHSCPPYNGDGLHLKVFQREVVVLTSNILLRKTSLIEAGLFNNSLRRHQDLQLLLDFTKEHKIHVINEYLTKIHADSAINRVNFDKAILVKKDFFKVVDSHLRIYPSKIQKQIISAHYFELALSAIKARRFFYTLKYLVKIGFDIQAYKNFFKRIKDKKYIAD